MKKVKSYSAEFKIVNFPKVDSREAREAREAPAVPAVPSVSSFQKSKKKLTKQNQEFINNISASGFKQFNI